MSTLAHVRPFSDDSPSIFYDFQNLYHCLSPMSFLHSISSTLWFLTPPTKGGSEDVMIWKVFHLEEAVEGEVHMAWEEYIWL